jgi:hypothetical protein
MARAHPPVIASVWWPPGLLAVVVALWLVADAPRDKRERPAEPTRPAPAWWFVRTAGGDAGGAAVPVRPVLGPALDPAAPPAPGTGRADTPDTAEVCGYGRVQRADDDPDLLQRIPADVRRAGLASVEALMLASADEQVRAAALAIGARWGDASRATRLAHLVRLVHLAAGSRDATVYAIALDACTAAPAAECALLSQAQWARLDPDNAQPWLALAAEARQQQDRDGEADAMRHAAHAHRSDFPAALLPHLVDRALGPVVPALQRTLGLSLGVSAQAAWRPSHSAQADVWCVAEEAGVADRREVCDALAQTLALGGTTVSDLNLGLAIGQRLGWPTPRLATLQQEQEAISETGAYTEVGVDWSCDAVERLSRTLRQLASGGERQAMRDAMARSGRSVAEWSAEHRRNMALAEAAATAATLATEAGPAP